MVRCKRCGTLNPAIDLWCSSCHAFLDWNAEPAQRPVSAAPAAKPTNPLPGSPLPGPPPVGEGNNPSRGREKAQRRWLLPVAVLAAAGAAVFVALPVAGGLRLAALQTAAKAGLPFAARQGTTATAGPAATTPTGQPTPQTTPASTPTPDLNPTPGVTPIQDDPARAVARFYALVQSHQFDSAAQLWSGRMQAKYPPAEFIDQRFASTRRIDLRAARVVASGDGVATVAIDVVEVSGDARHHWAGTWQLVLSPSGWLLNQPNLWALSLGGSD